MKIVRTLLCILITISLAVNAKTFNLTPNHNIFDEISIKPGSKWSYDGGFFQEINNGLYLKNNGEYKLLIKSPDGTLSIFSINITAGENLDPVVLNTAILDDKGPMINYQWDNVYTQNNITTAGPKSQLNWKYDEPVFNNQVFINKKLVADASSPLKIKEHFSHILINATDQFNNVSNTEIAFSTDFMAPEIKWEIISPKTKIDNKWYVNNMANINIKSSDAKTLLLNGSPINNIDKPLLIKNHSQITAIDELGNSATEIISWTQDTEEPFLVVKTLNKEYINPKNLHVKLNQNIQIIPVDKGSGVLKSEYYRNNRKWLPLPKNIVFVDTGLYRFEVKSFDNIGNELNAKIVFKITL